MRIGVNANYFQKPSTGIGVVTLSFMRALAALPEGKVHEWVWYYEGTVPSGTWPGNWRFERVTSWWTRDDIPHRFLWEYCSLPRAVRRDRCDILFSLYQSATRVPESMRHVMLVHDLVPKRFPEYLQQWRQRGYYQAIERAIRDVDHIIVPSQATAHDLESLLRIAATSITVVPLGVDPVFHTPLAPDVRDQTLGRYGLAPGYLYHGGGLEVRKNTALVLRAYAQAVHAGAADTLPPLVISGTMHAARNPLATPVQDVVAELGLADRVRLIGWVPDQDVPALYQGAVGFIFPSRYEGFGLPVLEAFASGTPVITTTAGSLAEVAQDAALIVSPDDVDGLTRAITQLLADQDVRAALATQGQKRAAHYSWPRFASSVVSALLQ